MDRLYKLSLRIRRNWPGYSIFKEYSFLPIFFVAGAALEFVMINWHVGEVNFYKVYKRNKVEELVALRLKELEKEKSSNKLEDSV